MEREARAGHLTDEELFGLALPPVGEPEALPAHLLQCSRCGRALQEWKAAVRQLAEEDVDPVRRRSPEEWRAAEDRTLEALRSARKARRPRALPWAAGLAAAVLLAALLWPARPPAPAPSGPSEQSAELSPEDAADDALLREVARLSRGEDRGGWDGLAPDPEDPEREEDRL
ncbi:MAG: hypothetical protein ACRD3M_05125 [Thermoanaerobaculia bacterium]